MPSSKALEAWFDDPGSSSSVKRFLRAERYLTGLGGGVLVAVGLRRRSLGGALLAAVGTGLVVRGVIGARGKRKGLRFLPPKWNEGIRVHRAVTIAKDPSEVFGHAHSLDQISRLTRRVQTIRDLGGGRQKVMVRLPRGGYLEWDAKVEWHEPERRITWRCGDESGPRHRGVVSFGSAPGDRGTEVHVVLEYEPTPTMMGFAVQRFSAEEIAFRLSEDLRRYKQRVECGEAATIAEQPSGRRTGLRDRKRRPRPDESREITVYQTPEARA